MNSQNFFYILKMFNFGISWKIKLFIFFIIIFIAFLLYYSRRSEDKSFREFLEEKKRKREEKEKHTEVHAEMKVHLGESDTINITEDNRQQYRPLKEDIKKTSHVQLLQNKIDKKKHLRRSHTITNNHFSQKKSDSFNNQKEWVSEEFCRDILENIYQRPFSKARPDFLKNELTGKNMELDGYNEELGIAFEYQGIQHYIYPNFTGQTKSSFLQQVKRDKLKLDLCDDNNVYLITIPYYIKPSEMRNFIVENLPQ